MFLLFFAQMPAATVVMEACGSAHFWARKIQELGHRVVLLPPHQVRPYVVRNKTDRTDAKGILEAYRKADIRPVPVKSVSQQVLVTLHRFRSGWLAARTAQAHLRSSITRAGFVRFSPFLYGFRQGHSRPSTPASPTDSRTGL